MFEQNEQQVGLTFNLLDKKAKNKFYGITISVFSVCVILTLMIAFAISYALTSQYNATVIAWMYKNWLYILIPSLIIFIGAFIFMWLLNRLPLPWLIVAAVFFILFFGLFIGILLPMVTLNYSGKGTTLFSWKIVGIMLIPAGIMGVTGLLGYFELVNMRTIKWLSIILLVVFVILVIASFFIFSNKVERIICSVAIALLTVSSIAQFYMLKQRAEQMKFEQSPVIWREATLAGLNLYLTYIQLLRFILELFGRR